MAGGMRLAELEFLLLLPAFMREDEAAIGLSKAMDELLGKPSERIPTIRTWDQIQNLNSKECDEMAWELDVDWYDDTIGLDEKRATIEAALQIKRKRGTKWAVEQLIIAYFGDGYVAEWYEIGESPYTFIVLTTNESITPEGYAKFVEAAKKAKNVRSHIAGVFYFWEQGPTAVETAMGYASYGYGFRQAGTYPIPATIGVAVDNAVEVDPDPEPVRYSITEAGTIDCGTYPQIATLGALLRHAAATEPVLAPTPYEFVRCGTRRCGE